ncbi:MAG: 30S ribosome-binding factor RbfA [Acidimicrobiales bacterium]|jgi:ribosome-binding factor A|nr:30S ribosome-binding factor RbfA [Acidimicrobiales bacterium]
MSRPSSRRTHTTARDYPRTARLNELLREIIGDELERLDDDRLQLLTVVGVACDPDLRHATVFYDNLEGEAGDDDTLAALADVRVRLQAAIGRQARIKRVPELAFRPDPAVRAGEHIDGLLRELHHDEAADAGPTAAGEDGGVGDDA